MSRFEKIAATEFHFDSDFERSFMGSSLPSSPPSSRCSSFFGAPVAVDKAGDNVDEEQDSPTDLALSLTELKEKLYPQLVSVEQLRPPAGLSTGFDVIDDFLLWKGIPKGDLTLLSGQPGTGATTLWLQTAVRIQEQKKWVAWVNSDWELLPGALVQAKINLKKMLVVRKPADSSQLFWVLQEMISSSLFEMVGCHLPEGSLKIHQLQKLKKLARTHQVALVLVSPAKQWLNQSLFSLVIDCQGDYFTIQRAAHRPTPFTIPGGLIHADLMSQLTTDTRSFLR